MAERRRRGLDLADLLRSVDDAPPVMAADVVGRHLAEAFGASEVSLLLADFSGKALIRLGHAETHRVDRKQGRETAERVPLAGGPHGRALVKQKVEVESWDGGARVFAPVTNRGEAIGVLELTLAEAPDRETVAEVEAAAHALAYVIIANRRFTDLFEWGQRSVQLTVAAEVQHRLLPGSFTCEGGQFTLAAWLEPAGEVAGDTFDFAVERDTLHLSVTDAMGHAVGASVLATLLVGALRNARRAGVGLAEQAASANEGLGDYADWQGPFVTGQLARIDLHTATAYIVNAGHPPPLRLHNGRIEHLPLKADLPFGIQPDSDYRVQPVSLEQGDRLVFLTDGMLDRNAARADIEAVIVDSAGMHPREAVQHLAHAVLQASNGHLNDDATALCLDWHGGIAEER